MNPEPTELPVRDIDIITIIHLIEHLKNPEIYLKKWIKSIKKNGTIIIVLPLDDEEYLEHLKIYTLEDIKKLIQPLCHSYGLEIRDRVGGRKEAIAVLQFRETTKVSIKIDPSITPDKRFVPTDVYLEVTNYCNLSCFMCPNKSLKRKRGFMSWELFKKIVDECSEIEGKGIDFYLHHQGEPLLDPLLVKRIKYIKSKCKKSHVTFSTNGTLLTKKKSEEILEAGLDFMVFSLDSIDPDIYSEIRGTKLETVMKNINHLLETRDRLKSKVAITMQMVLCDKNKHEEKIFKKMWADKKVRIVVKYMHNFLTEGTSFITDKLSNRQLLPCMQPFMYLMVYWNGDLGLCCWDADHYIDLGNLKTKSVLEAFNSEPFRKIREAMLIGDCKDIFPCNQCSQIYGYDMNIHIYSKRLRVKKEDVKEKR